MAKGATSAYRGAMDKKITHPTKLCALCERPFSWRKKWARDWDNVRYCSDRCRETRVKSNLAKPDPA